MPISTLDRIRQGLSYRLMQLAFRIGKIEGDYPIRKPIDPTDLEVLASSEFQKSVAEVGDLTLLDTARLANLWNLCRLTDPKGCILEVGTYRGGGALHLSNSCPDREILVFDSFAGFDTLHANLDRRFRDDMFKDTSKKAVERLFTSKNRTCTVVEGFFPDSCAERSLPPVSFVHLDVDLYKATLDSLNFLTGKSILLSKSLIVLDDYNRHAEGVNQAVAEFTSVNPEWVAFPLFPGQCLLLGRGWFAVKGNSTKS
jgi:hypothetical protein